jgi:hypothetical protein
MTSGLTFNAVGQFLKNVTLGSSIQGIEYLQYKAVLLNSAEQL